MSLYPNESAVPFRVADFWSSYKAERFRKLLLEGWAKAAPGSLLDREAARYAPRLK